MSKQAKIIIYSVVLLISFLLKGKTNGWLNDLGVTDPNKSSEPYDNIRSDINDKKSSNSTKKPPTKIIKPEEPNLLPGLDEITSLPTFHPTPKNGFSPYDEYFGKGIYNNATKNSFKIKNSNNSDAVVLLVDAYSGRKVRNEFVNKGSTFTMTGVPNGTYYLEWFSGNNWSPELIVGSRYKGGFQTNSGFTKTTDTNDWMKVEGYQEWTVTLYQVEGGDVESEKIDADEFFN